jgi:hypothetical protein
MVLLGFKVLKFYFLTLSWLENKTCKLHYFLTGVVQSNPVNSAVRSESTTLRGSPPSQGGKFCLSYLSNLV